MPKKNNSIPTSQDEIPVFAGKIAHGLELHAEAAGLTFTTADAVRDATSLVTTKQSILHTLVADRQTSLAKAVSLADADGKKFILAAKKVLRLQLGEKWNQSWFQAGFLDPNIRNPKTQNEREALLKALAGYFDGRAEREAATQGITGARAMELYVAMNTARTKLADSAKAQQDAREARDAALTDLRKLLRGVVAELKIRLNRESSLWTAFGVSAPKAPAPRPRKPKVAKRTRGTRSAATSPARATNPTAEEAGTGSAGVALAV